ncbi:MAG: glycosyltransferase family 2 protein [Clostridia bacterium]|nr:glycosyltransferase family 2 protein [Clostridia bacterium]
MHNLIDRSGLTPPYVAIIVPVYNVEKYLRRALDSCLAQTLQEIEIIPVNDCSPDGCQAILEAYAARYPGKVIPQRHAVNQGVSAARRTGVHTARAPYILFLDADDALHPQACELLLKEALSGDHDLVLFTALRVDEQGFSQPYGTIPEDLSPSQLIRSGFGVFCLYFYHRSLLSDDSIFVSMFFEDVAAVPAIFPAVRSAGQVAEPPLYRYYVNRNSITGTFQRRPDKLRDFYRALPHLWSLSEGPFKSDFAYRIASLLLRWQQRFPALTVSNVRHVQALFPQVEPWLPEDFPAHLRRQLDEIMALPEEPPVPMTLYLDGFGPGAEAQAEEARRVCPDITCTILTADNCDIASAPDCVREALNAGRHSEAAAWFAMERISHSGGFYAAPETHVLPGVYTMLYTPAFFCPASGNLVSLHFFGGAAGHPWWARIRDAVDDTSGEGGLQQRVAALLRNQGGMTLSPLGESGPDGIALLPVSRCMLPGTANCCYVETSWIDSLYETITSANRHSLFLLHHLDCMEKEACRAQRLEVRLSEARAQRDRYLTERDEARRDRRSLKKQLNALASMTPAAHLKQALRRLLHREDNRHA